LFVALVDGNNLRQITFGAASTIRPCWFADGARILAQQVWGLDESGGSIVFIELNEKIRNLMESPVNFRTLKNNGFVTDGGMSRGLSTVDFNDNNWQDISVANSSVQPNFIYKNDSSFLKRLYENEIIRFPANTEGLQWIDYDNDGDLDVFATNILQNQNYLFRNDSNKIFKRVMAGQLTNDKSSSTASCWCDVDKDGDLDVFVVNRDDLDDVMYLNKGDGNFVKLAGPWNNNKGDGRSCVWGDVGNDGWPDLYVGNYLSKTGAVPKKERNFFYRNKAKLLFEETKQGDFVTDEALTYGVSFVDYDNDGDLDLFVTNVAKTDHNYLYENDGKGNFKKLENAISSDNYHPSKGHT
jgi:enediyne biosynthesis protein E4